MPPYYWAIGAVVQQSGRYGADQGRKLHEMLEGATPREAKASGLFLGILMGGYPRLIRAPLRRLRWHWRPPTVQKVLGAYTGETARKFPLVEDPLDRTLLMPTLVFLCVNKISASSRRELPGTRHIGPRSTEQDISIRSVEYNLNVFATLRGRLC